MFFPPNRPLSKEQLCWVLLSKKGFFKRARVVCDTGKDAEDDNDNDGSNQNKDEKGKEKSQAVTPTSTTVVDEDRRILVRYPKGSTYRVRRTNLLPVLEDSKQSKSKPPLVIVSSETKDYRRVAITHTLPDDHFVEIGCDFGILCDSVDCKSALGIDKSETSIGIARERYPNQTFWLCDIFEEEFETMMKSASSSSSPSSLSSVGDKEEGHSEDAMTSSNQLAARDFFQQPLVVAIDINGNRLLPAVIDCIQLVMDKLKPRLIVVKSRELYSVLQQQQKQQQQQDNSIDDGGDGQDLKNKRHKSK